MLYGRTSTYKGILIKQRILTRFNSSLPLESNITERFHFEQDTTSIQQLITEYNQSQSNTTHYVNGWIESPVKKIGKGLYFTTLRDMRGHRIQLIDKHEPSLFTQQQCTTLESCVQIQGKLQPKRQRSSSDQSQKTEYEIVLKQVQCLNKSNLIPTQLKSNTTEQEKMSLPPQYRFLQMRLNQSESLLQRRYKVNHTMRQWLYDNNFTEIETPILFKPTPEGAREFVVPTRQQRASDRRPLFYSLTQSPQQYKQLLMSSGVTKYYQFAKCFRDEDLRKDRQPEFTQLDLEMSFAGGKQIRSFVQDLIIKVWSKEQSSLPTKKTLLTVNKNGSNFELIPCQEISTINNFTYKEVMTKYGIDKPNLIAPNLQLVNLTELTGIYHQQSDYPVWECLVLKNVLSNGIKDYKKNWKLYLDPSLYNNREPVAIPILSKDLQSSLNENPSFQSSVPNELIQQMNEKLSLSQSDMVFISNRQPDQMIFENPTPLGRLRQLILSSSKGEALFRETPNINDDVAIWVTDFPLFSPVETETTTLDKSKIQYPQYIQDKYVSTHHPFTMVNLSTYSNLQSQPLKCLGEHYDLVINGVELGGGSQRIHDPELQDYIFQNVLKIDNSHELFGHLLDAFAMGTPPHAGFAVGFDRMCTMLFNRQSIRDVIAFPKSATGVDQVVKSPAVVDDTLLSDYHIQQRK